MTAVFDVIDIRHFFPQRIHRYLFTKISTKLAKSEMYVSGLLFSTLVLNDDDIRFYVICIYIVIVKGIQQLLVPLLPLENDLPPSWKRKK